MSIAEARLRNAEPTHRRSYVADRRPQGLRRVPWLARCCTRSAWAWLSEVSAPALMAAMVLLIPAAAAPVLLRDGNVALTVGARMLARTKAPTPSSPKRFWVAAGKIEGLPRQMQSL